MNNEQQTMNKKGFTLIEVMVAILLITVGLTGALSLIQQVISFIAISSSRLTAAYLAQEGIEIVRNIRDTNWLEARYLEVSWDEGISLGDWEADYTTGSTDEEEELSEPFDGGRFLNIDSNSFYSYESGSPTIFKRKISIESLPGPDEVFRVNSKVQWEERGRTHTVSAKEDFYDWR